MKNSIRWGQFHTIKTSYYQIWRNILKKSLSVLPSIHSITIQFPKLGISSILEAETMLGCCKEMRMSNSLRKSER